MKFAFFGDSICAGQGVSIHRTWAVRLSALLEDALGQGGRGLVTMNPSINGDTTRMALGRIAHDIQNHRVDAIMIQFGMNDANHWDTDLGAPRVSEAAFAANLGEIIDRARRFGAETVFLNTNHPTTRTHKAMAGGARTYQQSNERYNEIIREVAAGRDGVILNDVEQDWRQRIDAGASRLADMLLPDELHLSEAGHDAYLDFLSARVVSRMTSL